MGSVQVTRHSQLQYVYTVVLRMLTLRHRFLASHGLVPSLPPIFWMKMLPCSKHKAIAQHQNLDLDLNLPEGN